MAAIIAVDKQAGFHSLRFDDSLWRARQNHTHPETGSSSQQYHQQ
jgi:hypothetical protein